MVNKTVKPPYRTITRIEKEVLAGTTIVYSRMS